MSSYKADQIRKSTGNTPSIDASSILQRTAINNAELEPALEIASTALRTSGQPLDASTRAFMEPRFGHDFTKIRVHTDRQAMSTASVLGARAYTIGHDIVFGEGQYRPDSQQGRRLLAHETAHVIQQGAGAVRGGFSETTALEQHADAVADAVVAGHSSEVLLQRLPVGGRATPALQLKPTKLSWSRVDVTFNAYLRKLGDIDKALAETKKQIGPPMPNDYVPPPRREEAKKAEQRKQQIQALRTLYREYMGDEGFQRRNFGGTYFTAMDADLASEETILSLPQDPLFQKWVKGRQAQIYYERIKQQNLAYWEEMGGPEMGFTPEEARQFVESRYARTDRGEPLYEKGTGVLVGYIKHVYAEKALGGAVGTVTREFYDVNGEYVRSEKPTTVLTPAAEVFQDLARNAPVTGYAINVAEIGFGQSFNLRDWGRELQTEDVADRAVSALPGGDLARGGIEAATGVSLSGGEDIRRYWEDDPRLLTRKERIGKGIVVGTAAVSAGIGLGTAKLRPKVSVDTPDIPARQLGTGLPRKAAGGVPEGSGPHPPGGAILRNPVATPDLLESMPRYPTAGRERVAFEEMKAPAPRSVGAAGNDPRKWLPPRRSRSKAGEAGNEPPVQPPAKPAQTPARPSLGEPATELQEGIFTAGGKTKQQLIRYWMDEIDSLKNQIRTTTSPAKRKELQKRLKEAGASIGRIQRHYPSKPKQSEFEVRHLYGGGEETPYAHGTRRTQRIKESSVPDVTPRGGLRHHLEVKRFLLDGSRRGSRVKRGQLDHDALNEMIGKLKKEVGPRRESALPAHEGSQQAVVIDLRGQRLNRADIQQVRRRVSDETGVPLNAVEVWVYGGKRLRRRVDKTKKPE